MILRSAHARHFSSPPSLLGKGAGGFGRKETRRGLSLIEVLLAMTIFLLSLVAISSLVDMGSTREYEARLQTRGARLALSKLADFESGIESLESAATEGTFESSDDAGWSWTAEVNPQGPPYLYLVSITVTRDVKGVPFSLTLSQMIFDPAYLGTAGEAARPDASGTGGGTP